MTTPILGLSEIAEGLASQASLHNQSLREFEARSIRVLSRTTTAPPASPAEGDAYIIPAAATGVWASKTNQVAAWIGGAWGYYVPVEGVILWINDTNNTYAYDGAVWVLNSGSGSGTVTAVSVVTANGFTGTVATATTTPAITITTNLATGIVKATAAGGAISVAVAADFPTLNQSTTGSAATLTTPRTIDGVAFDGSANIAVIAPSTNAATSKVTPVDADVLPLADSAAAFVLKKLTWANLKATLKTYFDTLYAAAAGSPAKVIAAPAWAAAMTLDWTANDVYRITLAGATTFTFSGGSDGKNCMVELLQDATGSRVVTWPAAARFSTDIVSPTLTTTASKMDRVGFQFNNGLTKYDCVAVVKGY